MVLSVKSFKFMVLLGTFSDKDVVFYLHDPTEDSENVLKKILRGVFILSNRM